MKIKFLSFIASFFMVSFVITSCLDDDNNIEYSPDATIHAFALDTAGLGKYKFTIDQLSREIYNEDSLPVHADTIIDKILIKTLTTASGVVTMKDKSGNDSVLNINDSIDLRKELIIKVWSTEALAGISPNQTKEYKIKVNVHRHDPDSLRWKYMHEIDNQITGEQKSIILGSEVFTYSVVGTKLYAYKNSLTSFSSWKPKEVEGLPEGKLPTSIIAFQFDRSRTMLYATSNGDDKVYESADGEIWNESTMFGEGVELLLATLTNNDVSRICYIKKGADDKRYFYYQTNDKQQEVIETYEGGKVPSNFPTKNISYTVYKSSTNVNSVLLVGDTETATLADDSELETTIVWAYDGSKWVEFSTTSSVAYCPKYTQPSIIYYNDLVYIFGQDFSSIYVSNQGLFWRKANAKFSFLYRDWSKGGTPDPDVDPEFRGKTNYSMVLDPNTQNLWIIFSKGSASFKEEVEKEESTKATTTETRTYTHESEVWRGRLNQLWFDLASAGK